MTVSTKIHSENILDNQLPAEVNCENNDPEKPKRRSFTEKLKALFGESNKVRTLQEFVSEKQKEKENQAADQSSSPPSSPTPAQRRSFKDMVDKMTSYLPDLLPKKSKAVIFLEAGHYWLKRGKSLEASDKYRDCLAELKFGRREGKGFNDDEIENIIVPALCGLATCCLEQREYQKALTYCNQVMELRPMNRKAAYLQGIANVELGSFKAAMKFYRNENRKI
jgi:tetratricopeptide (TPR) repeat protein